VPDPTSVARILRVMRRDAGWTLKRLGEELGLSVPYLSDLELGRRRCSPQRFRDVCRALGVVYDWPKLPGEVRP